MNLKTHAAVNRIAASHPDGCAALIASTTAVTASPAIAAASAVASAGIV
jgi:hypothetical protein